MKAVVLAGGQGTRLHPYTLVIPKPLVPVGGRPILETVLRQLAGAGSTDVTLCLGHLAGFVRAYLESADRLPRDLRVSTVVEDRPLGTAGALRLVPRPAEPFLVMNGDVLTRLDLAALVREHRASGAALTVAVTRRAHAVDLGVIEFDEADRLTGYVEKPSRTYWASMGVNVYDPRVVDRIADGERIDFPDLVHRLLEAGETVRVHRSEAYWLDIGRHADHERADLEFATAFPEYRD